MLSTQYIDKIIHYAYEEDMTYGDITTDTLIPENQHSEAKLIAKESGVIAGLYIFERAFHLLDLQINIISSINEGDWVEEGTVIATLKGPSRALLKGERTALNLLQRLSGIATTTHQLVEELHGTHAKLVDTRKTTAGLRALEKYAVRVGGGYNHRFNLSDAVLIKDNHIQAVGNIKRAIELARASVPHTMRIEIEVETLNQLQEALDAKADIIMLDNMSLETMCEAVKINNHVAILEASGNVTLESIRAIAMTGVDIISCGALTHSVKAMDISLKFL